MSHGSRIGMICTALVCTALLLLSGGMVSGSPSLIDPIPPPLPKPKPPRSAGGLTPIVPENDKEWGLPEEFLAPLYKSSQRYGAFARRFICRETAIQADYDSNGSVDNEVKRIYNYLLLQSPEGDSLSESRREYRKDGKLKDGEINDRDPFPPAYAWVFLFSRFNQTYFAFRLLDERFDGFDWVYEIQFKGSLPYTDGRDIRQWEGKVLVDVVTGTPLQILAEPSGQTPRLEAMFRRYQSSFNVLGLRTAPKPLGYRADIDFRYQEKELRFPTRLRYNTFRAVATGKVIPIRASSRMYGDYQFFDINTEEKIGEPTKP